MAIETDETIVVAVKPKRPHRPSWRDRQPDEFGDLLLKDLDPNRDTFTMEQQADIRACRSSEDVKRMIHFDLGNIKNPNIDTATLCFGGLLLRNFEIPPMLMSWRFYTICQAQLAIQETSEMMLDKTLPGPDRVNAAKARVEAIKALSILIDKAQRLAKVVGAMKVPKAKELPVVKPAKNDAPKFD